MYQLLLLFLASFLFTGTGHPINKNPVSCAPKGKCYGNTPCYACTNCRYCAHCNSGGTCGVCAKAKATTENSPSSLYTTPAYVGQCRAITKKGTRCSRKGTYNGYCWQHRQ